MLLLSFAVSITPSSFVKTNTDLRKSLTGPNPFVDQINVNIYSNVNESAKIKLYTADGKLVVQEIRQLSIGRNILALKNLNRLNCQNYILRIERFSGVEVIKVLKSLD